MSTRTEKRLKIGGVPPLLTPIVQLWAGSKTRKSSSVPSMTKNWNLSILTSSGVSEVAPRKLTGPRWAETGLQLRVWTTTVQKRQILWRKIVGKKCYPCRMSLAILLNRTFGGSCMFSQGKMWLTWPTSRVLSSRSDAEIKTRRLATKLTDVAQSSLIRHEKYQYSMTTKPTTTSQPTHQSSCRQISRIMGATRI